MQLNPNIDPDDPDDPDASAAYFAEELAKELLDEERQLDPADLSDFVGRVIADAGWQCDEPPTIVLDVSDDSDYSAWHEGATGTIHLHPKLLAPLTVLHKVAHWLRPRDRHGPQFRGTLVALIHAAEGHETAQVFLLAFEEQGVPADPAYSACDGG